MKLTKCHLRFGNNVLFFFWNDGICLRDLFTRRKKTYICWVGRASYLVIVQSSGEAQIGIYSNIEIY